MYTVVRQYDAAGELGDLLAKRTDDVHGIISTVPGFVAYYAIRDGNQLTTITVCNDRAGTDESSRRAAASILLRPDEVDEPLARTQLDHQLTWRTEGSALVWAAISTGPMWQPGGPVGRRFPWKNDTGSTRT